VKHFSDSNVVVVCTVRNIAASFTRELDNANKAFSCFKSVRWIVAESDSDDDTVYVGEKLAANDEAFDFIVLGNLTATLPYRTQRIAHARNRALDYLKSTSFVEDIDLIILADIDGRNRNLTRQSIESCWQIEDWDVITANQEGIYYDIWGLRHKSWCPNDCWREVNELSNFIGEKNAIQVAVTSRQIVLNSNSKPFLVDSAFGGLAIYKKSLLEEMIYLESLYDGFEICDHVYVNLQLSAKGYKIYINPKMINYKETWLERLKRDGTTRKLLIPVKRFIGSFFNLR
jgi:glycosyltransferase involved in cell wall biosynthesis